MKKAAAHIFNLITMAIRDNDFDEQEKKAIIRIATRVGLSVKDLEFAITEKKMKIEVPLSLAERIQHLYDLVIVMLADGILHEEELKYISHFIKIYGFDDNYDGKPIVIDLEIIKNQLSFKKFLQEFRQITADELSSVVVDRELNIKFPLYNSELLNLGPLPKSLYIFFLLKSEPINIVDLGLEENKKLLCNIYSLMPSADFDVCGRINNLTNPDGLIFNSNRSLIKKALLNALPADNPELINHYYISGVRNQKKSIKLNKELIHIQPRIL